MIDNEYCLRLSYYNYKVLIDGNVKMYQHLGEARQSKNIGVKFIPTNHSSNRYMYMYRNLLMTIKRYKYKTFYGFFNYMILAFVKKMFTILLFENNKIDNAKAIIKGISFGIKYNVDTFY